MLKKISTSAHAVRVHILLGAVLFAISMYPVLSSAQTLRERANQKMDAYQNRQETLETKRAELKQRLGELSDERKAKLAEQLADQMNALNERLTNHYLNFLANLETILGKIETRLNEAEGNKADALSKIAAAKSKLMEVKNKVLSQQAKIYTVTFTTEEKLREAYQTVKQQLQADHAAMRENVGAAKQAVHDAFQALRSLISE